MSYWKNKPIKQMVKLMANLTGDNSISDKDIEYISDTMKQINLENQQYHRDMLNFLFSNGWTKTNANLYEANTLSLATRFSLRRFSERE